MAPTILITGFGPFPGAPFNPTGPLVAHLARTKLPRTKIVTHIFETSYAAVDRDLPTLLKRHKPDAVLMFGLASRARIVRINRINLRLAGTQGVLQVVIILVMASFVT